MSAIAGIIRFDQGPVDRDDFDRIDQVIRSRGGDRFQRLMGPSCAFSFAGFHFTPEDLQDRQPLALQDGSYFMFCGRLDNRPELIRSLGLDRTEAASLSDSGLAAAAWLKWSEEGLARWVGPHVTIVWQPGTQRVIIARGAPFGRSLIFHRSGDTLYFSTSIDALFALPQIPRAFNDEVLADVLLGAPSGSEFLYQGLEAVPTSHWFELSRSGSRQHRYWHPGAVETLKFRREEECWEAFEALFSEVVQQHLRSTGDIGIRLSGGLDSSLLAAFCCRQLAKQGRVLHGYTRIPRPDADLPDTLGGRYLDESAKVRALSAMYPNLKANLIPPDNRSILDGLNDWFVANHTPAAASPTYQSGYRPMLEQARDDGIKLLFNAGCGNHTFSYTGFGRLQQLFKRGQWRRLRRELDALGRHGYHKRHLIIQEVIKPSLPAWYTDMRVRQKGRKMPSWDRFSALDAEFASTTGAESRLRQQQNIRAYWDYWTSWQQRTQPFLDGQQVAQGGGADMLYGFDQRDPSGDRRVLEFCLAVPERFYLKDGVNRRLVRRGMRHLLPQCIVDEHRVGLQDADWFDRVARDRESILQRYRQFRDDPDVNRLFDMDKIDALWAEFESTDWRTTPRRQAVRMQLALLGPLHAGSYVRWFYGKND